METPTRRRVQDSSISGSDIPITPRSSVFAYTTERLRIGIPALQLLPLSEEPISPTSPALYKFQEFLPAIERILRDRAVDRGEEFGEDEVELVYRCIPDEEVSDDELTVLIFARWRDDDDGQKWFLAAEDIREILLSSFLTRKIKVELLDRKLIAPRTISALEPEHPLVGAWTRVNSRIHTIIRETARLQEAWKSIDVLRLGYERDDNQETPVTISITIDWNLDRRDWVLAE